jgi:hypothetical protein
VNTRRLTLRVTWRTAQTFIAQGRVGRNMERHSLRVFWFALICVAGMAPAWSADGGAIRQAPNPCAAYGAGFALPPFGNTCARISGHVRTEYGVGRAPSSGGSGAFWSNTTSSVPQQRSVLRSQGTVEIEGRTKTSAGDVRTYIRLKGDSPVYR